ncbi:hypothetical protein L218DRAFT_884536, partial [Marasmius fiardii PR-910]
MQTPATNGLFSSFLPHEQALKIQKMFRSTISSSERSIISQFLNDAEKELKEYQTEINRLNATILSLENKRDRLRSRITNYRSLLSPIHRLPPEILTNILAYGCGATEHLVYMVLPSVVSFSMVCGRWRELALSTPSLWSNIAIDLESWIGVLVGECVADVEGSLKIIMPLAVRIVKMFLSRSGTCPLTLAFTFPD